MRTGASGSPERRSRPGKPRERFSEPLAWLPNGAACENGLAKVIVLFPEPRKRRCDGDVRLPEVVADLALAPLLLAGLLRCGKCGASFSKESSGKAFAGEYPHAYYNCLSFLRLRKASSKGKRIRVNILDRIVLDHVADKLFTVERCRALASDLVDRAGLLRKKTNERRVSLV